MMSKTSLSRFRRFARRLRSNRSGLALLEFALSFPIVLTGGLMAVDVTQMAIVNMKVSQVALNLADNMSRMGLMTGTQQQVREVDINDAFESVRDQGALISLVQNGRVILTSLENQTGTQKMHWQRCIGVKGGAGYDSSYGLATPLTTAGTTTGAGDQGVNAATGMGDPGAMVNAPSGSGVIFVEVNFLHKPFFPWLFNQSRMHYVASFIVRDIRDFRQIYNPNPQAPRSTCNLYNP